MPRIRREHRFLYDRLRLPNGEREVRGRKRNNGITMRKVLYIAILMQTVQEAGFAAVPARANINPNPKARDEATERLIMHHDLLEPHEPLHSANMTLGTA